MPIYSFNFNDAEDPRKFVDQRFDPRSPDGPEQRPLMALPLAKDGLTREDIWFERQNINIAEEIHEFLPKGYYTMDRGLKNYFSGIEVPTKDGTRIMQVRISGGDKPFLIWAQDLKRGRIKLPVMSIKREGDEHYPAKFSPAHMHYMAKRFVDKEGTKIALTYRPVPSLINYVLSVLAEHKRDLEYIHYQIRTRFNPVAEFMVEDEHMRGSVFMKYNNMTVAVDDDIPADQKANKRYDYSITMEGWLPLPEKIVPSILGKVTTLKDGTVSLLSGEIFDVIEGKSGPIPVQAR